MVSLINQTPSAGRLVRRAALSTFWAFAGAGIAQKTHAQVFVPGDGTMKVLKEIEENCNMGDAALAESLLKQLNAFLKEAHEKGSPEIEHGPLAPSTIPPQLLQAMRKWGYIDLDITTRRDTPQGVRFNCQLS